MYYLFIIIFNLFIKSFFLLDLSNLPEQISRISELFDSKTLKILYEQLELEFPADKFSPG
jgi:hypothetical protein